jgi:hypothetical protein
MGYVFIGDGAHPDGAVWSGQERVVGASGREKDVGIL